MQVALELSHTFSPRYRKDELGNLVAVSELMQATPGLKSTVLELPEARRTYANRMHVVRTSKVCNCLSCGCQVCRTGEGIKAQQPQETSQQDIATPSGEAAEALTALQDIQDRVNFVELDATSPDWPVADSALPSKECMRAHERAH